MIFIKKETGFYKSFDGSPIYYECRGVGKPLVFIYGIACPINHWLKQLRYFSTSYRTIVIDLRGHHKSSNLKKGAQMNIEAIARDINELLKFFNIKKALFIGHSFGVQALLETYKLFPHIFYACVFSNGFVSYPLKTMKGGWIVQFIFWTLKKGFKKFPQFFLKLWKLGFNNRFSPKFSDIIGGFNLKFAKLKDVEVYFRGAANLNIESFIQLFEDSIQYNGSKILNHINLPCLIIGGKRDGLTPEKVQTSLAQKIKRSEYIRILEGSHCTPIDQPHLFNQHVKTFLKKINY